MQNDCQVIHLTCNQQVQPLGIGTAMPRLGWQLSCARRGAAQQAFQLIAESVGGGVLWDSGRVSSAQNQDVAWGGAPLASRTAVIWRVRVWDETGAAAEWSEPARFETALLDEADWGAARWITACGCDYPDPLCGGLSGAGPAPILRRNFTIPAPVRQARVYLCALGYGDLWLNGVPADPGRVLAPAPAQYDVGAFYVTYDVTRHLHAGENAIGVVLGTGWYNAHTHGAWQFENAPWRDRVKLLARLEIELSDGQRMTLVSDESWRGGTGPIRFDGLRNGEHYDARCERPGWASPGQDDTAWGGVTIIPGPGGVLRPQENGVHAQELIRPVAIRETAPGEYVADMGQNLAGWTRLEGVVGPAGTEIKLRHSELCKEDGRIDNASIAMFIKTGGCQTDQVTLAGEAQPLTWEPRFSYHGFRYVEITGFPGCPTAAQIAARVVHSELPTAGRFECSNPLLNKIQENTLWAYRGNFVGIPTDCPHREKNGWTGDASLAAEAGLFNFHATSAYRQWLETIADAMRPNGQLPGIVPSGGWGYNWGSGPAWDAVYTHLPWYVYLYTGDLAILARHYAGMKRHLAYMDSMSTGDLVKYGLGDWCCPQGCSAHKAPTALTSTGYYFANARILAQSAAALGYPAEATRFAEQAERIRAVFNLAFYDPATGIYQGDCQTSNACALFHGLVPDGEDAKVLAALIRRIEQDHFTCEFGILGAKYVLNALTAQGRADVAWKIATQTAYPSWGHWIGRGATTLWESWNGNDSQNHIMFGDISAWFYKTLAGLNPDPAAPGFRHFFVRPCPQPGLDWVKASHLSPHGEIKIAWRQSANGGFELELLVPANCTATVALPATVTAQCQESDQPADSAPGLALLGIEPVRRVYRAQAGAYQFRVS